MDYHQRYHLAALIDRAIHRIQWPSNAQEPDYVAVLVNSLPGIIKGGLTRVLPGRKVLTGGSFIHQKPIVHFLNKPGLKDPELGDLLIVCREKRSSGPVYNAMLLQAKCCDNPLYVQIKKDHQFVLYSEWPEFEYKRAGRLNGKRRSVLPKTITQGAQYLLIDKDDPYQLFTATVDCPLNGSRNFACSLASIVSFDDGRTFQANLPHDDWSQMVLDLLRISAVSVFNRRNSGFKNANRWNGDKAFSYLMNPEEIEKEIGVVSQDYREDTNEDLSGMSVICIDIGEETER